VFTFAFDFQLNFLLWPVACVLILTGAFFLELLWHFCLFIYFLFFCLFFVFVFLLKSEYKPVPQKKGNICSDFDENKNSSLATFALASANSQAREAIGKGSNCNFNIML